MAATATEQIIHNGARNLVLKYTFSGIDGDASAETLVDASNFVTTGINALRLERVKWSATGFTTKLAWDADADVDLIELSPGAGELDFTDVGGLSNTNALQTGDIKFTTTGYTSGDSGHIILWLKKRVGLSAIVAASPAPSAASLSLTGIVPTIAVE